MASVGGDVAENDRDDFGVGLGDRLGEIGPWSARLGTNVVHQLITNLSNPLEARHVA